MHAWVTRLSIVAGKRKREQMQPGLRAVGPQDRFVVQWLEPSGRLAQKTIKLRGKAGKRLADEIAESTTAALVRNEYVELKRETWTQFREHVERVFIPLKRKKTQQSYIETLKLFESIAKPGTMRSINGGHIADFRAGLLKRRGRKNESTISAATANRHLRQLKSLLHQAAEYGYMTKVPKIKLLDEPERDVRYMTEADFDAIYKACETATVPSGRPYSAADYWRALMVVGVMTGMRSMEMLKMLWKEIELDAAVLKIPSSRAKGKRKARIPLHDVVVEHLRKLLAYELVQEEVFYWPQGIKALYKQWHAIQEAAEIDLPCEEEHEHTPACHRYGFHSLKRSCGTFNAKRLPQASLNVFMRHRSAKTTEKYYIDDGKQLEGVADSMWVPESAKGA